MMRVLAALGALLILVSCAQRPTAPPQTADGAPIRSIHPWEVKDAVPRADPILSAGNKSPYTVRGVTYHIMPSAHGYQEEGIASWYGTKFHGRKTSNGEVFDLYAATAAHKTLPIPSYVRVTNKANGRSVVVRVNDRGPFHPDRVIDLSYGAAVKLGFMEQGTARVQVEALNIAGVDDRRGSTDGQYRYLQVGAFGSRSAAEGLQRELQALVGEPVFLSPVQVGANTMHRVRIGPMDSGARLQSTLQLLQSRGYGTAQPLP